MQVNSVDYNRARKVLLKRYRFLSVEDVEDTLHDALLYLLENPHPDTVSPMAALYTVFKTVRFTEYRKRFIAWNGDRTPVYLMSVDFNALFNNDSDSFTVQELSIRNDMVEQGYTCELGLDDVEYYAKTVPLKLKTLTQPEREAVSLFLSGYDKKQVASIVGVTPQAIGSRFNQAMRRM